MKKKPSEAFKDWAARLSSLANFCSNVAGLIDKADAEGVHITIRRAEPKVYRRVRREKKVCDCPNCTRARELEQSRAN